jgi:hypothetical protein
LPRKRRAKRQWTDPVILVPIIGAVIAAIVGPIVVPLIQDYIRQQHTNDGSISPTSSPTPVSTPVPAADITLDTDKNTYGSGDLVTVSGNFDELVQGKTARLDVYDPKGEVFQPFNESFSEGDREDWSDAYPRLSDVQVKPNDKGLFSYRFPLDNPVGGSLVRGVYKIEVTYGGITKNATFMVR